MHNHVTARTELKTRSNKDVPVTHSELGCAPKRVDHMVTAYDAMEVPDTSMLLMLHTGRRSMKGGLFGRPHEHAQQPCKRLPKTLSFCARLHHLCVVVSRQLSEHHESPRWSQCVESHVQTSMYSVRVIGRLLLIARRHAGEAYRTRSERSALCAPTVQAASTRPQHGIANRPSPWAETAIPQATKLTVLRL